MRPTFTKDPLFKKGLKIRREVVGAEYVERRLAAANEYTWPFEELATKVAWGMVWGRPGLPCKVRSFLNLAALTAMNMRHELKLHIRSALRNGLTRKEISEALLQSPITHHASIPCNPGTVFPPAPCSPPSRGSGSRRRRRGRIS